MLQYFYVIYVLNLSILNVFLQARLDKTVKQQHMESTYDHRNVGFHGQMLHCLSYSHKLIYCTQVQVLWPHKTIFDLVPPCSCLSNLLYLIHCSSHTHYRHAPVLHVLDSSIWKCCLDNMAGIFLTLRTHHLRKAFLTDLSEVTSLPFQLLIPKTQFFCFQFFYSTKNYKLICISDINSFNNSHGD